MKGEDVACLVGMGSNGCRNGSRQLGEQPLRRGGSLNAIEREGQDEGGNNFLLGRS